MWQSEKIFARLKKPMIKRDAPRSGPISSCSISRAWSTKAPCSPPISSASRRQIANVAPYADKIIGYQYIGLMNPEDSGSFAGHESSAELYRQYAEYLNK